MQFLLNPLLLNIILFWVLFAASRIALKLYISIIQRSSNVYKFKIHHKFFSIAFISMYIFLFIFFFYILRLLSMPRIINLEQVLQNITIYKGHIQSLLTSYFLTTSYFLVIISITIIILCLAIKKMHQLAFVEIYKWFLVFITNYQYISNKNIWNFCLKISSLAHTDLMAHLAIKCSRYLTKNAQKYNIMYKDKPFSQYYTQLPFYHYHKIILFIFDYHYYNMIKKSLPVIIIIYDCIWNNFIITHVFYFFLLYIPLMLFQRIATTFATNAFFISQYLCTIYYKVENCIYAIPQNFRPILDDYLLSDLTINPDLGLNCQAELLIKEISRFEQYPEDKSLYVNPGREFLHTYDNKVFYHVVEDEEGEPHDGEEWYIIADKRKKDNHEEKQED